MLRKKLAQKNDVKASDPVESIGKQTHVAGSAFLRCITYNTESFTDQICNDLLNCDSSSLDHVHWIHVTGVDQPGIIQNIAKEFSLHPLLVEDIMTTRQRPKVDDYGNYLYIVFRLVKFDNNLRLIDEQISIVLGDNYLISFVQTPTNIFDPLIDRLKQGKGIIRKQASSFLAYALIDAVVDSYFELLDKAGLEVETLEDLQTRESNQQKILPQIHRLRREIIIMRKAIWPIREVVAKLEREDSSHLINSTTRLYLRDVYDHAILIVDTIDAFRDLSRGILDVCLAQMSYRMNEIIKILTVVGSIFIPLTFITSFYGMNFDMPEYDWKYSYSIVIALMLLLTLGMLRYFKRKHWF